MVSVGPKNDNDDREVNVNAMIAEVGAKSVATVQAPNLRTRAHVVIHASGGVATSAHAMA